MSGFPSLTDLHCSAHLANYPSQRLHMNSSDDYFDRAKPTPLAKLVLCAKFAGDHIPDAQIPNFRGFDVFVQISIIAGRITAHGRRHESRQLGRSEEHTS